MTKCFIFMHFRQIFATEHFIHYILFLLIIYVGIDRQRCIEVSMVAIPTPLLHLLKKRYKYA